MPLFFGQVERKHVINWIVVRHPHFVAALDRLKPRDYADTDVDAMAFKNTNILITHMQNQGPVRPEQPHYTYDNRHDLYHCHVVNASPTYNVIWEVDEQLRIIHILNIAPHENFNYTRKVNKTESINNALKTLQTTSHYKNMFQIHNMRLNPEVKEMYKDFMACLADAPKKPNSAIKNITYEEMGKVLQRKNAC